MSISAIRALGGCRGTIPIGAEGLHLEVLRKGISSRKLIDDPKALPVQIGALAPICTEKKRSYAQEERDAEDEAGKPSPPLRQRAHRNISFRYKRIPVCRLI